jgi:hypothetical protein
VQSFRGVCIKTALIVMGLGSIARGDSLQTMVSQGKICPILFDAMNGGAWRDLRPTFNDLLLCPDWTWITTGVA